MKKQVGWYNPKSRGVCMKYDKELFSAYNRYTVPVFTDETPPVPEYKKPRGENSEDDGLMDEIRVQALENQVVMILAMLSLRSEGLTSVEIRRNLIRMRKRSVELLERLKKNEQARSD